MNPYICSICGHDTSTIDYDYLVNYDHLSCHLGVWGGTGAIKTKTKPMKIKNWDKINGYTYKGYAIVNPVFNTNGFTYYADVLNLNLPQKPKWHLELVIDGDGYNKHTLTLLDGEGMNIKHLIELVDIRTSALFRLRYEEVIDEMLSRRLTSAPKQTTAFNIAGNSGIYNNPNSISTTLTQSSIVDTIKELQKQIDELNAKLNTPINPF